MYIEALHTHIDVLHLPTQHRLEPCYTLQEEFMRHEHRSPKVGDIFKLRLLLPKFNEDAQDENDLAALEVFQGRKRNLEEANCEAGNESISKYTFLNNIMKLVKIYLKNTCFLYSLRVWYACIEQ